MGDDLGRDAPAPITRDTLIKISEEILKARVDPERSLISQGLDSLGATEFLEAMHLRGCEVDYEILLSETTIDALIDALRRTSDLGPAPTSGERPDHPVPLAAPQSLWTSLHAEGWGNWGNISLCLSIPASLIRATYLPAIVQALCEANDAMRMRLVQEEEGAGATWQEVIPDFQLPVTLRDAPEREADALRLVEAFEGDEHTPFAPSTRALVLQSPTTEGRHWLCLTMHHVFSDRISLQSLGRQMRRMIASNALRVADPPEVGYAEFAGWQAHRLTNEGRDRTLRALRDLLAGADISASRPAPACADDDLRILGDLPAEARLRPTETQTLERLARRLDTTLPLLLHAVSSVIGAHLTVAAGATTGDGDLLWCHVVSNRERFPVLKDIVGCLDTSVPVAVRLGDGETLASLCRKTRDAFSAAHGLAPDLPRGSWIATGHTGDTGSGDGSTGSALIERFPHINIVRVPSISPEDHALDIREHAIRRVQKTRWGLLMRVSLPPSEARTPSGDATRGIAFSAFAEDRALAGLLPYCLVEVLRSLLARPGADVGDLPVADMTAEMRARLARAAAQIRLASGRLQTPPTGPPVIYEKLIARQRRWYAHDERHDLCRDAQNRFVGTVANPFPFTQLDKLKERAFLEAQDVPLPRLLHVLPKEGLARSLSAVGPALPESFVIKPVGAGHSFGVTIVRDGLDLTRDGADFDVGAVAAELTAMAEQGACRHEGRLFPFNFSSFLIEELVIDERGFPAPTDYKVFMIGETFLWLQIHFRQDGFSWVAFLDADFRILPEPAWDPATCWRTHRALVCTEQGMVDARKPACLAGILERSRRLAGDMGIFVRLDWYADAARGPLMGEITTFPHMLQPRGFYSPWANTRVGSLWRDPDGAVPKHAGGKGGDNSARYDAIDRLLADDSAAETGLAAFFPEQTAAPWAADDAITFDALRRYADGFDLGPWGVVSGERIGVLVANGVQLGALLIAAMNRYVAVPIGDKLPPARVAALLEEDGIGVLVVVAGSDEAAVARAAAARRAGVRIIELIPQASFPLAALPAPPAGLSAGPASPANRLDDTVLILRTSGSTGAPKTVSYTMRRLFRSGLLIARSLELGPGDVGISMLPLQRIGGIACNLVAPLLATGTMRHGRIFDPRAFLDALAGARGATWCYLVPTMWDMVLEYARAHPELGRTRPWPRLRAIRSAGSDLPPDTAKTLAGLFGDTVAVLPTYGMTEAMPIAAPPVSYRLDRPGSVGRVLPSVSVEIVDPATLSKRPDGAVGEITVRGPTVFEGYDPRGGPSGVEFTQRGYFRTGDLGHLSADGTGWLSVDGRLKEMINAGGETIAPLEIEAIMRTCPAWTDRDRGLWLMAFARTTTDLQEDVALAIIGQPADLDLGEILGWAKAEMPAAMVPKTFVCVGELPISDAGKRTRSSFAARFNDAVLTGEVGTLQVFDWRDQTAPPRLCQQEHAGHARNGDRSPPGTGTLEDVVAAVRSYLPHSVDIGPDTHMIEAGVNSLAAVELSIHLGDRFGVSLPTWVLSDHPTARALHSVISGMAVSGVEASDAPAPRSEPQPIPPPEAKPIASGPIRMLLLHGEGADADLMEKSLRATHWTGRMADRIEFVFMDAPFACAPMPEFHGTAVEAGMYGKAAYRSWCATDPAMLEQSVSAVIAALDLRQPIEAIGGICDGALIAGVVAARRPDIKALLCLASGPWSRLATAGRGALDAIACRSLHLTSDQDSLHTVAQQMEIVAQCEQAQVLKHARGHAVPILDDQLERQLGHLLEGVVAGRTEPRAIGTAVLPKRMPETQARLSANPGAASSLEPIVARAMARVLRIDKVLRDQDFFALGGDSLKALSLALMLEKRLDIDLPMEVMFVEGASVRSLARTIERRRGITASADVIALNGASSGKQIFALPPLHGQFIEYLALARAFEPKADLLGIRLRLLAPNVWPLRKTLEDLAREAATKIAEHGDPDHGDRRGINLIGASAAGVLAFETARILAEMGHQIGSLALIDSDAVPGGDRWPLPLKYMSEVQKDVSRRLRGKANFRKGVSQLHFRRKLVEWDPEPVAIRHPMFFRAELGTVDARQLDKWRAALEGELEVIPIQGGHDGYLDPKIAERIAGVICRRLWS